MTTKVAVVGGGIAGVSAAYRLRRDAAVTLYESADRLGGHANTVEVDDPLGLRGLDTAFIVFNQAHYPAFTDFLDELQVPSKEQPGRFCFFDLDRRRSYVSEDFELGEEQIRERYDEDFAGLWREARRFQEEAPRHFIRRQADMPLGEYLDRHGYSDAFRYGFIVLIATAAWSVPAERIWQMPASTIIAFFFAHGHEGLGGRAAPWRTVVGGSINYLRKASAQLRADGVSLRLGTPVRRITQEPGEVVITTDEGQERYDQVVIATHADDALAMLDAPTAQQRRLECVRYHGTRALLHTDARVMPADRGRWRSWNYGRIGADGEQRTWVVYYLNELHGFEAADDYFLTLDCPLEVDPGKTIQEFAYRHPILTVEVRALQSDIHSINAGDTRVAFAGSYFHSRRMGIDIIGNHEAAFDSGVAAAEAVLKRLPVTAR